MSTPPRLHAAGRDPSSFVLRRILPITVAATLVTGSLRWLATERGVVPDQVGVIVMTIFAIATFTGLALWAARALRESAATQRRADRDELYRLMAGNMPGGGIFLFDRDLRYILAEGQNFRNVGLDGRALEGKTIWEALEPDAAAAVEPSYRAALAGEGTVFEMGFRENTYLVTVAPTYDAEGAIVGGVVHTQDITDRKELEEQLHQSQKLEAVGALAGGIAHDFNNLLTVIAGYASLSLRSLKPGDPQRVGPEQIAIAAQRAAALTQQLLAFSRKQLLLPQAVDVNAVVDDLMPMLRSLIEERIDLVVDLDPRIPPVMFDPGRLEQVIVNLVVNARDAIGATGTIGVETSEVYLDEEYVAAHGDAQVGAHVALVVSDNGVGFDEETRMRIFEPFFTTKEVDRGTGLGLSTVHGIVKQSGGNIWVYSEPGRGATFKIYLPVAADAVVESPRHTADAPLNAAVAGARVLVVEDHEAVRHLTVRVLTEAGYAVVDASSVDEALDVLYGHSVDLILSDLVMPGGTGERIADTPDERGVRPPIIFMSGYTEATISREELLAAGAQFIEKPFTPATLLSAVAEALAGVRV